ncbi:hypothetical protein KEH51_14895 [[Brevibacterium] frigoritolerans]|uniref:Uncharacterized protein n=1 Tax=Peribacillus frigoritolerans TaxID=450367 RepID=A0A941J6Y5_9BACI|nr:hypothetical protein [Peribacillus frigoritolerans]
MIGAKVRDSCRSSRKGETPQAFTPRRLTAPPRKASIWGKSTTTHYLVNSNKVCENSLIFMYGPCVGPTMENLSAHLFSVVKR